MELIGKHILTIDDIKHVLYDRHNDTYLIVTKHNHHITNLEFSTSEYETLVAELGVAFEPEDHEDDS